MTKESITVNHQPLDTRAIEELNISGLSVDLVLDYSNDNGGGYYVYAKYNNNHITRQIYAHRGNPRFFKNIGRAIDWGKKMGMKHCILRITYEDFNPE